MKTKKALIYSLAFMSFAFFLIGGCKKDSTDSPANTVTDYDGNVYHTITIGTQTWLVENLKSTHFNDGTSIANITDNTEWGASTSPAYSFYNNDANNKTTYGALYNWYTINPSTNGNKNICPAGWHIPSLEEWNTLINAMGGTSAAGGPLKEIGTLHWSSPNSGATNTSGFTAMGGGFRHSVAGDFEYFGSIGSWWTSSIIDGTHATSMYMSTNSTNAGNTSSLYDVGSAIRCIKGVTVGK